MLLVAQAAGLLDVKGVAVVSLAIQIAAAVGIVRAGERWLSVASVFAVLWIFYFPIRLLVLAFWGPSPFDFPAVIDASPAQLLDASNATMCGFVMFYAGVIATRRFRARASVDDIAVSFGQYAGIAVTGLATKAVLTATHLSSGILSNIGDLVLVGIAGTACLEVKSGRRPYVSATLALFASADGYLNGFKSLIIAPWAAWLIGRAAGNHRPRLRYLLMALITTVIGFGMVQGVRNAAVAGRTSLNPVSALTAGLSEYDLAHGIPAHYTGDGVVGNVFNGVLYRLDGIDYYIAITTRVPSDMPYQGGRTLWQPALSVLPGGKQVFGLDPGFKQLSLGEWSNQTFISPEPVPNPAAQSITPPGDLYLNFGVAGVLIGMLVLGFVVGTFDRRFVVRGPASAGIVAFAGLPLANLDSNIAYAMVTSGLRLGICAVLFGWLAAQRRKPLLQSKPAA